MLDRSRFLLVHGADHRRWAARYGIDPFTAPCGSCGAELTTSIPLALGRLRGLVAPRCACGNDRPPYCVVGLDLDDILDGGRRA